MAGSWQGGKDTFRLEPHSQECWLMCPRSCERGYFVAECIARKRNATYLGSFRENMRVRRRASRTGVPTQGTWERDKRTNELSTLTGEL